jgi:hypothetical protein
MKGRMVYCGKRGIFGYEDRDSVRGKYDDGNARGHQGRNRKSLGDTEVKGVP